MPPKQKTAVLPAPVSVEPPEFSGERQLAAKLSWVMGQVGYIEKRGFNPHFRYNFVREADLKAHISPLLSKLKVFMLADVIAHERVPRNDSTVTILTVQWTFHDGETGESFTGTSVGYGDDKGDKGANKAMTAALKFFLIPTFLVVSGDDAEADISTDRRADEPVREVTVTASTAEQPERGGHSKQATTFQIQQISELSQSLDLGSEGVAAVMKQVLGIEVELPAEPKSAQAGAVARALLGLTAEDIGKIVGTLRRQFEAIENASKESEADDLPSVPEDPGIGY